MKNDPGYEAPRGDRSSAASPTETDLHRAHDPYAAFRFPAFRFYAIGNLISVVGRQMLSMAVGYEIYAHTNSAAAIGMVGLVLAIPVIALAIPAGQAADRFRRKSILLVTQMLSAFCSLALAWLSLNRYALPETIALRQASDILESVARVFEKTNDIHFDSSVPLVFALLLISGSARAFGWAARGAFMSNLVPTGTFGSAVTWNSSIFQIASVGGPALGGLVIAKFGFASAYAIDALCALIFFVLLLPISARQKHAVREKLNLAVLFAGLRFVWKTKLILATITLDLFAVLLGGATALLPIYAEKILHVGAIGLGWMRAAPAIGAVVMGLTIAFMPPMKHAGKTLLWAVAGFGLATVVFGLSKSYWLSLTMLALTGALDNISVVVRHTLVQTLTPDAMRGRVSAVNNVFIGSSNELGAFESGLTAARWGPVASVVVGGIGTMAVVLCALFKWPALLRIGRLDRPAK